MNSGLHGLDLGPLGNTAVWVAVFAGLVWAALPDTKKWMEPLALWCAVVIAFSLAWRIILEGPVPALIFFLFVLGAAWEFFKTTVPKA